MQGTFAATAKGLGARHPHPVGRQLQALVKQLLPPKGAPVVSLPAKLAQPCSPGHSSVSLLRMLGQADAES